MIKKLILPGFLCLLNSALFSQEYQRCGSYEYLQQELVSDPVRAQNLEIINQEALEDQNSTSSQKIAAVVTIPVVFHVVFENAVENISSQRIMEQLTVLNEDYRKLNADAANIPAGFQSLAADTEIQFCLASLDPQGNATTGIIRTQTTETSFTMDNKVKFTSQGGSDAWDRNKYLNIWICDLGSTLLGFGQFPGGAASTDGVVLHYRFTGKTGATAPYNLGRTATHEVGHWLNLYHIWGDDGLSCSGSDFVNDTPNQEDETYGCYSPSSIRLSCNNSPDGDMWMNYMDYTNDGCMYMFTNGQKARMQSVLNGSRASLKSSNGCSAVSVESVSGRNLNVYPSPTSGFINITTEFVNSRDLKVKVLNSLGEIIHSENILELNGTTVLNLSEYPNGIYFIELSDSYEKTVKKIILNK